MPMRVALTVPAKCGYGKDAVALVHMEAYLLGKDGKT